MLLDVEIYLKLVEHLDSGYRTRIVKKGPVIHASDLHCVQIVGSI